MILIFMRILLFIILPSFIGGIAAHFNWRWYTLMLILAVYSLPVIVAQYYLLK
jgi:hypothetical protein